MSAAEIGQTVAGQASATAGSTQPATPVRPAVSWWGDVWHRFRQQRLSLAAAVMLVVLVFLALTAPLISAAASSSPAR